MSPPRSDSSDGPGRGPSMDELAELLCADPASCPDSQVAEGVQVLLRHSGLVDAALCRWTSVFDARTIWMGNGARSGASWLAAHAEVSRPHGSALIHRARDLRSCPAVETAYGAGAIGTPKVRLLLRARKAHPDLFKEHEAGLVEHVTPLTVTQAATVVARWEQLAEASKDLSDPSNDAEDDVPGNSVPGDAPADPAKENSLHLSRSLDGRWFGDLDLDPTTGAELDSAITAHVDRLFQQGTYNAEDGLSASRRRAEAVAELALRGAQPGTTKHGDPRPSVGIQIDHRTLAGIPAEDLTDGLSRTCSLDDGTPIPRLAAERLLCTARISHLLTRINKDGAVETLGITDLLRDATRRQRRAMKLRDGGCVFPGCAAPVDWCDAHHLTPYEIGGPTLLFNLVFVCRFHHHQVHEGGWRMWRDQTGKLRLQDPHGTEVACPPHGHLVQPLTPAPDAASPSERPTGEDANPSQDPDAPGSTDPPSRAEPPDDANPSQDADAPDDAEPPSNAGQFHGSSPPPWPMPPRFRRPNDT